MQSDSSHSLHQVLAVIPAYNCEHSIGDIVLNVLKQGISAIVIDDASHDATAAVARSAGAQVLQHPNNWGKGYALRTGFIWALQQKKTTIVTLDADGQHDPSDLPLFLNKRFEYDLIIGQRKLSLDVMPFESWIGNKISTFFISIFCKAQFFDTQCGFRLYSNKLLRNLPLTGGRFETETELLMRASRLAMNIAWVPIKTIYRKEQCDPKVRRSYFHNGYDTLRVISVVLRSPHFPKKADNAA
jgi:glycosyltransferase involved in cell wall biosynthesis